MRTKERPTRLRTAALAVAGLLVSLLPAVAAAPASAAGSNLALGKTATASSANGQFVVSNINDGNQSSYWESTNGSTTFPQWAQIDLGAATSVNQVVLKLPTGWGARTETLSVQGSTDNSTFSTIVASTGYTFDPNSANTVTINFGTTSARYVRVNITANTGWPAGQLSEFEIYGTASSSSNLALGKTMSASGTSQNYVPGNADDGDQSTYWESTNNAFPQWLQVDLGASVAVNKVVLQTPVANWAARTETLAVQGSTDGTNFSDIVASAGYTFDPASNSTVTISFNQTTTRYVRLNITANTGWPAGQISEFQVYGPAGGTTPPNAPTSLAYTQATNGAITLTWTASSSSGVTNYDVYANNSLLTSVPGTATTYTDNPPTTETVTYFVRARDASGNQSANSNSVTRNGSSATPPTAPGNLAYTQPQSGQLKLTWSASTDAVGVTGYNIYRNSAKIASVSGSTLTYTDSVADTLTVMYDVTATNAAGLESAASNTVTRTGSGGTSTNLALNKPIDGTAYTYIYAPANANDGDVTTYFEGSSYPSNLTVHLGANADLSSVVVKLNPATVWSARTQTIAVLGREQSATAFTTLVPAQSYSFDPNSNGNSVTIPVSGRVADVELSITSNSGAPGGQAAEFQVFGTPAPNPDLTVTSSSWTPSAPVETDSITTSAVVKNGGTAASVATDVNFYLGTNKVGSTTVGALAPGASATVSAGIGTQTAGTYQLTTKVDESHKNFNLTADQSYTNPTSLVVTPVQSADLVGTLNWTPSNPAAGNTVTFTATLKNQGTIATTSGSHGITVTLLDSNNNTVATLNGSVGGAIASGATAAPVTLGSWTAVNGKYTAHMVIAADPNELPIKQPHLTSDTPFFVGQGANMPYDMYEAEAGQLGGGAAIVGPNRTIGDIAGEASGREAVTLDNTGNSVSWTSREPTNTFDLRYSIPDASGGGGINATLDLYANGTLVEPLNLTSHYAWLYGAETGPGDSPSAGSPRHIYDESGFVLPTSYPQGTVFKLQKDASNTSQYAIDFMNLEQATPIANPDPTHLIVPAGFTEQDVQNAVNTVTQDTTGAHTGVYLPAGQYSLTGRITVSGKVKVVGAGVWYTQFVAPQSQTDTDTGWDVQSSASGSSFSGFAWFGNYTTRQDGPGHTFQLTNTSNLTIDNVWIEHNVVGVWGLTAVTNSTFTNMRIRDTLADGINLTNGSQGNLISNDEARTTGDDSFALFAAQDSCGGCKETNNTIQNVTALTPWRAAGVAVYGGFNNTVQNFYVADTLCYPGLTVSSLNFGFPFEGFEDSPPTTIQNFSLARDGGHFWGNQAFGAIWMFSATNPFTGIRINNANITDPTYTGIMFQTDYVGGTAQFPFADTIFTNTTITGAHQNNDGFGNGKSGFGIWANPLPESGQGPAVGSVTFNHLVESNNDVNIQNTTTTLTITVNP